MKTKEFFKALGILLLVASSALLASCSNDDDSSIDPAGTVTLNMLDEQNGKTRLGESDVYINKAYNFHTSSCLITDKGSAGGLGGSTSPELNNLVREAAITPGHVYQIFDSEALREFPSGTKAVMLGASYYQAYAVSPIQKETSTIGAVIKYIPVHPEANGLPEYGYKFGDVYYSGQSVSMQLPKGAECFWYDGVPEVFDISVEGGTLQMRLLRTPTGYNGVSGNYNIYLRLGNVYTSVIVRVN